MSSAAHCTITWRGGEYTGPVDSSSRPDGHGVFIWPSPASGSSSASTSGSSSTSVSGSRRSEGLWCHGLQHGRFLIQFTDGSRETDQFDEGVLIESTRAGLDFKLTNREQSLWTVSFPDGACYTDVECTNDAARTQRGRAGQIDVRAWLNDIGLLVDHPYFTALIANGYEDIATLRGCSDAELKDAGIELPGHRKKMMMTLAEYTDGQEEHTKPAAVAAAAEANETNKQTVTAAPEASAE